VLDREEMKAGCLEMAKSIAEMCPGMPGGEDSELEEALDGFIAECCPDGGKISDESLKISFDAMLAVALPKLCGSAPGKDPVEFFDKIDQCMFATINMQIDMYLGGLLNLKSPRVFPKFPDDYETFEKTVVFGADVIAPNSGIYLVNVVLDPNHRVHTPAASTCSACSAACTPPCSAACTPPCSAACTPPSARTVRMGKEGGSQQWQTFLC
jgi:hypothetical protein